MAELMAIWLVFQLVAKYNVCNLKIYIDTQGEVLEINFPTILINEDGVIIQDIKRLCASLNVHNVHFMPRV